MPTPTKPERVEVGQRWGIAGLGGASLVERIDGERADFENGWNGILRLMLDPSYGGWVYLGPATPGTATVTPAAPCRPDCVRPPEHIGGCIPAAPATAPSKPPTSPVYGRMVGELRAPDGTPRTALEAIQAKREPEPWLPSCDIDCDIPDADEGWRR